MPESCSDLGAEGQLLVERDHVRNLQRELAASARRVEELEAGLRRILDHGKTHDEPCWAIHQGDCAEVFQEIARALLKDGER